MIDRVYLVTPDEVAQIDYLAQESFYLSSREGPVPIRFMVPIHARRAMNKLVEDHGPELKGTFLYQALRKRAQRDNHIPTHVRSIRGSSRMLRDPVSGRFSGSWQPMLILGWYDVAYLDNNYLEKVGP